MWILEYAGTYLYHAQHLVDEFMLLLLLCVVTPKDFPIREQTRDDIRVLFGVQTSLSSFLLCEDTYW